MFNAIKYNEWVYEGYRGAIELPQSIRTYFDGFADEFNEISEKQKLLDLGYVLKRGYDLATQIKACLYGRPHIGENEFKRSFAGLIECVDKTYMNDNGYNGRIEDFSIDSLVGILSNILDDHYVEYSDYTHNII